MLTQKSPYPPQEPQNKPTYRWTTIFVGGHSFQVKVRVSGKTSRNINASINNKNVIDWSIWNQNNRYLSDKDGDVSFFVKSNSSGMIEAHRDTENGEKIYQLLNSKNQPVYYNDKIEDEHYRFEYEFNL